MRTAPPVGWTAWRSRLDRAIGLLLAVAVFATAPLLHLEEDVALASAPVVRSLLSAERAFGLNQNWKMFAPPGRLPAGLGVALRYDEGWTDVVPLIDLFRATEVDSIVANRGHSRLHSFLRTSSKQDSRGEDMEIGRRFFFENLGLFFCRGDGSIQNLREARFYHQQSWVPPFHPSHSFPVEPTTSSRERPLYTFSCSETGS